MKTSVLHILKEKRKALIGTAAVVTIAGFSFVAGRKMQAPTVVPMVEEKHSSEPASHEMKRKPASAEPESDSRESDPESESVDEEEVQIALHLNASSHSASPTTETQGAEHAPDDHASADDAHAKKSGEEEHTIDHRAPAAHGHGHAEKHAEASAEATSEHGEQPGFVAKILHTYGAAFESVHDKVVRLHHSEEENRSLRMENAQLRVRLETQKFDCRVSEAKAHAEKVGTKLNAQTGTRVGRTLASIQYQMPENLLPEQLHALGVSYLQANDYERGAAILTFLTELEGDATFKKPENYMLAAIAWYKLENYVNAAQFFDRALQDPTASAKVKTQTQVWKAIIAERTKHSAEAQEWLRKTLETDPQSKEAQWINPQEGDRKPASHPEAQPAHGKKEDEQKTHH